MEIIPYMGVKRRKFKKRIHNGMFIWTDPSEHIQQQIFWYGFYEKKYVLTWEGMLKDNWIVFDVGAHSGYYSLIASGKLLHGHVYAFEPDSASVLQISENLELNQIKNADVVHVAVYDKDSHAIFYKAALENTGMSGLTQPENFSGTSEPVQTIRIDSWFRENKLQRIDCVKMDIEGAEYKALEGMRGLLQQFHPVLFIEISSDLLQRHGNTPLQVFELLYSFQYKSYQVRNVNELVRVDSVIEDELVVFMMN